MTLNPDQVDTAPNESLSSWSPASDAEMERVREQVGRILSSSTFRNSKRFPAFLRYTVEHALASTEPLKERTIGHEVFAREPGYDTGQDPVVRMTAAEVRKRLTQYYLQPEHQNEIVIAYEPGSYVPEFFQRARRAASSDGSAPVAASPPRRRSLSLSAWLAVIAIVIVTGALIGATLVGRRSAGPESPNASNRFWTPIVESSSPVLICIGDPSSVGRADSASAQNAAPLDGLTIEEFLRSNSVRYTDSVTLALLAGELRARGKPFRIRRPAATELKDLRDGPVVLIGGFNNPWTLRLSDGLRFTLATDARGSYIRDRNHPDDRRWQPDVPGRLLKNMQQTYGLITRVQDPSTGHSVLTVSGLVLGTGAAAECLMNAECLESAERMVGHDLDRRNVQIVVSAAVIGEDAGAPKVVAAHSW